MRVCIQRVLSASVRLPQENNRVCGTIGQGLLVLLGVAVGDTEKDAEFLAKKCCELRIFEDETGKMNRPLNGEMLVVSQFTLYGDCRHGRRPSFTNAAPPEQANRLYEHFLNEVRKRNISVAAGVFQTDMHVELINDGPVTILIDSQ